MKTVRYDPCNPDSAPKEAPKNEGNKNPVAN